MPWQFFKGKRCARHGKLFSDATQTTHAPQFDGSLIVYDVCKEIQEKLGETAGGADHGLFLPNEDYSRGKWLHPGRTLDYYDLKSGVWARRLTMGMNGRAALYIVHECGGK